MAQNPVDPFNGDMDDLFNQLMGGMNGMNSENRRYLINGREVTPEEFAQYRRTGRMPGAGAQRPPQMASRGRSHKASWKSLAAT